MRSSGIRVLSCLATGLSTPRASRSLLPILGIYYTEIFILVHKKKHFKNKINFKKVPLTLSIEIQCNVKNKDIQQSTKRYLVLSCLDTGGPSGLDGPGLFSGLWSRKLLLAKRLAMRSLSLESCLCVSRTGSTRSGGPAERRSCRARWSSSRWPGEEET